MANGNGRPRPVPGDDCCCAAPKFVNVTFKGNWVGHVNVHNAACSSNDSGKPVHFNFGGDQKASAIALAAASVFQFDGDNINVIDGGSGNDNIGIDDSQTGTATAGATAIAANEQ